MIETTKYDVSVVLALNKIDEFTFTAINSVVEQVNINHEVIVVANGLQAQAINLVLSREYSQNSHVKIIVSCIPQLAFALNLGISESNSDYIARMDADDISIPHRLSTQLSFLMKHKLDMVGSDVYLINSRSEIIGEKKVPKGSFIKNYFIKGNPFYHPTVIFSKKLFYEARGYNAGFNSEDYDLWLRFDRLKPKWDNFPEKLLKYRIHSKTSQGSLLAYCEVSGYYLREFLLKPSFKLFFGGFVATMKAIYVKFIKL